MYTRKDNKPMSMKNLIEAIQQHKTDGNKVNLDAPVTMSNDEEGNDMLSLYGVEISKSGKITLWPAHI